MAGSAVTAARPLVNGRVGAAGEIATALGCAATLLSSSASVRWAGGAGGGLLLIVADQATPVEPHADGLRRALLDVGVGPGDAVAIERGSLTLDVAAGLGNRRCPSASQRLAAARARKHKDEIELIERAAELVAAGQQAVRQAAAPGASELELWRAAEAAMQELAGAPVDAGVDLMTGSRTAMVGAPPTARRLEPGDPVLFDLSPQRHGYWADSCATFACAGAVSAPVRRRHDAIRQALERGLREARVGTTAGAVDAAIRAELERHGLECPHHTGHGVGAAQQESPWLVPGEPTVIDEGMVLAIEPGSYADGFGVRLEHLALIEAAGARPLTTHALDP
jgi:Xaa-Pro aminopeptidase